MTLRPCDKPQSILASIYSRVFAVLVTSLLITSALSAATVAHWKFDSPGTWLQDSSGNAHHLTNGNSAGATYNAGAGAVDFSGGGAGTLSAPNSPAWTDLSFTVEAFITPDAVNSLRSIAGHFHTDTGRQWLVLLNDGKLNIILTSGTSELYFTANAFTLTAGHQYYVGVAVDLTAANPADRIVFYVQDLTTRSMLMSENVSTAFTSLISSTAGLYIGSTGHSSSRFDGLIHEVKISDIALASDALIAPEPGRNLFFMAGFTALMLRRRRSA